MKLGNGSFITMSSPSYSPVGASPNPLCSNNCKQRFYLLLSIGAFAFVVYYSSVKTTPQSSLSPLASLYDNNGQQDTTVLDHGDDVKNITRPNIVLILTDDQDTVLGGDAHMPHTRALLANKGTTLSNAFVASPLCCPSRASILTGRYVHNHGTVNNSISGHCSDSHWQDGPEKEAFSVHLSNAGYRTFFAGKYLNKYGSEHTGGVKHVPPGWHWWTGLVGNSVYYNYSLSVNGSREVHGDDPDSDYLTSVIWRSGKKFLDTVPDGDSSSSTHSSQPFFMMLSTPASHAPFTPQQKYAANFTDIAAPRTKNFNIANDDSKHWLLRLGKQPLSKGVVDKVDEVFRNRLRTLLTVDDMVADIVSTLEHKSLLQNTYIIFTSDNGYHLGQFSLPLDKREPYEFDIRVPFIIRGPGVAEGVVRPQPSTNVDIAPTILDLANVDISHSMDGISLKPLLVLGKNSFKNNVQKIATYKVTNSDDNLKRFSYGGVHSLKTPGHVSIIPYKSREEADDATPPKVSSSYNTREMLVEHYGEGNTEAPPTPCAYLGPGLSGCNPEMDCKCEDSWNNTYSCVRRLHLAGGGDSSGVLSATVSGGDTEVMNTVYCEWVDSEQFVEYYDLSSDECQLSNKWQVMTQQEKVEYKELLHRLKTCSGSSCW